MFLYVVNLPIVVSHCYLNYEFRVSHVDVDIRIELLQPVLDSELQRAITDDRLCYRWKPSISHRKTHRSKSSIIECPDYGLRGVYTADKTFIMDRLWVVSAEAIDLLVPEYKTRYPIYHSPASTTSSPHSSANLRTVRFICRDERAYYILAAQQGNTY